MSLRAWIEEGDMTAHEMGTRYGLQWCIGWAILGLGNFLHRNGAIGVGKEAIVRRFGLAYVAYLAGNSTTAIELGTMAG
jgi:hypothetical protein